MASRPGRAEGAPTPLIGRDRLVDRVVTLARTGPGAAVAGGRGSGRTSVLDAFRAELASSDDPLVVLAPAGADAPPFATLAPLLGGDVPDAVDAAALARCSAGLLHAVVAGADAPRRPVVVVDGLDEVDEASGSVLHQMAAAGRIGLVGSVLLAPGGTPTGRPWWASVLDRVDLDPLDRDDADTLAERLAGAPIDAAGRQRLWDLVRGHPGLLVAAVATADSAGAWELVGGLLSLVDEQVDVVAPEVLAQIAATPDEVRTVLRALAIAGRLPIDDAEALGGSARLTDAERRGLVRVEEDDDGSLWCAVTSDLVAAGLRAGLDGAGERVAWARLDQVLGASASPAPEVALARARALVGLRRPLEGTRRDDIGVLLAGTEAACHLTRWGDAVDLAARTWRATGDGRALVLLTQSLGFVADHEAIAALASEVASRDVDAESRLHLGTTVAISQFHRNDPSGAFATVARLREEHGDDTSRAVLDVFESRLRSFAGDQATAAELAGRWVEHADAGFRVEALTVVASTDANRGMAARARAGYDLAFAEALTEPDAPVALAGTPYLFRLSVVADEGRLDEAIEHAESVEREVARSGDETAHGWLALHLGRTYLRAGRPRGAARWFAEAVSDLRRVHRPGWLAFPAAGLVAAHALAGDLPAAREARTAWEAIPPHAVALFRGEEVRLAAWLDVVEGRAEVATAAFRRSADLSRAAGAVPSEAAALHDLARVGGADDRLVAAERLEELAARGDSPLVAAHALQARGLCGRGTDDLVDAATAYEALGSWLDASESWAEAARRSVDERSAAQARRGSERVAPHHEPVATPLLGQAGDRPTLTGREAEVAALVVEGRSRQEIAERLYVSVRTVDSHLQRVYRKLGVRGRDELVDAMG